ncbi:MAG: hypothetical protein KC931_25385, partial [Candidatus Omnitrophica bacterium]|nr:hypothetical protein [Candidatus Omnitrophota bacterium]
MNEVIKMRVFKLVVVIVGLFLLIQMGAATPLDSRFTFQGRYEDNGTPINGTRTLYFILWDAAENGNQIGSAQIVNEIQIVDGNFTVLLNSGNEFGADAFNGE